MIAYTDARKRGDTDQMTPGERLRFIQSGKAR